MKDHLPCRGSAAMIPAAERRQSIARGANPWNKGGTKNEYLDRRIKPLNLTAQEKGDLVAFLKALSGEGWQQIKEPKKFPE